MPLVPLTDGPFHGRGFKLVLSEAIALNGVFPSPVSFEALLAFLVSSIIAIRLLSVALGLGAGQRPPLLGTWCDRLSVDRRQRLWDTSGGGKVLIFDRRLVSPFVTGVIVLGVGDNDNFSQDLVELVSTAFLIPSPLDEDVETQSLDNSSGILPRCLSE